MRSAQIASRLSVVLLMASSTYAAAQEANYMQTGTITPPFKGGQNISAIVDVSSKAPLYTLVKTVSVWCQSPFQPSPSKGMFVSFLQDGAHGQTIVVPMSLQHAGVSPNGYNFFAGTVNPFIEFPSGQNITLLAYADEGTVNNLCSATITGLKNLKP